MRFKQDQTNSLILETSLQTFFFDELSKVNQKFQNPVPKLSIYYSSLVMDRFGLSQEFFDIEDGKVRNKILGIKLLESNELDTKKKIRVLQDVGDTALFLCGYFSESVNEKILDISYYKDIGQMAYSRLNGLVPSFYEVESFYNSISKQFETLTSLMQIVQRQNMHEKDDLIYVIGNNVKAG